jgi:hypothetical protein
MQGYITIAMDRERYVDMALNLARSLKYFDPKRPRCLVYNNKVTLPPETASLFDHVVNLADMPDYIGCMNKLRLYEATPFEETMYIDADCLLVKPDIDRHWAALSQNYFGMTGEKRTTGTWNNLDFEKVCKALSIPYVVQMNSGVFYFQKGPEAQRFFDRLHELYRDHRDLLSNIHQGRAGQYADEPFLGAAMGEFRIDPLGGTAEEGSLMVTTWRARNCSFDPARGASRIDKPSRYWFGIGQLPRSWVVHSPTIAHFIGLKPQKVYEETSRFFNRALAG